MIQMSTYGFLSSNQQLPDNCRNDATLQYFMRNSDFIRVIENRTEGTIRYNDGNQIQVCCASKEKALSKAKAFGVSIDEGRHINALEIFLSKLAPGSILMFTSIEQFSSGSEAAVYLYHKTDEEGIILRFLDQPWLDNELYRSCRQEYARIDSVIQRIIKATYETIEPRNSYMSLISVTETNKDKKNEAEK
jgi:hypothetical protein